jgi:hypothetical protein
MSLIHEITVSKNIVSMTQETFKALVQRSYEVGFEAKYYGYDDDFGENTLKRLLSQAEETNLEKRLSELSDQYEKLSASVEKLTKRKK